MASALVRFAVATARTSSSSNLTSSVNTALRRTNPALFSRFNTTSGNASALIRTLATAAVGRKSVTKKTTTTKRTTRKAATRAKPKKKAAPKKKKALKKKPVKKRRVLSDKQKEAAKKRQTAARVKDLKAQALTPPALKTVSPYAVFVAQNIEKGVSRTNLAEASRTVARKYKSLSPHEREVRYIQTH
jgi:uncharacterized protein YaiL (DUF2058 family)